MSRSFDLPISVLDLSPIADGSDAGQALRNSLDLARHVERLGFKRYWVAEHHNMPGIASAATSVVLAYIGAGTSTIRLGAGGIMLPNHAPLVIAEQFGTLEALFPGRIDLGIGRAPGSDQLTARALRRNLVGSEDTFPRDVTELLGYFAPALPGQPVRAVPGAGSDIPVWLLGSSLYSAQLAAALGLPFAFASHFAPDLLMQALHLYRRAFTPSQYLKAPYALAAVNVVAAPTIEEARRLFTSHQQSFINLRRGRPGLLPPPVAAMDDLWSPAEREMVDRTLTYTIVATADSVAERIADFAQHTGADEIMVTGHIYDHQARLRSFEIVADAVIKKEPSGTGA